MAIDRLCVSVCVCVFTNAPFVVVLYCVVLCNNSVESICTTTANCEQFTRELRNRTLPMRPLFLHTLIIHAHRTHAHIHTYRIHFYDRTFMIELLTLCNIVCCTPARTCRSVRMRTFANFDKLFSTRTVRNSPIDTTKQLVSATPQFNSTMARIILEEWVPRRS